MIAAIDSWLSNTMVAENWIVIGKTLAMLFSWLNSLMYRLNEVHQIDYLLVTIITVSHKQ